VLLGVGVLDLLHVLVGAGHHDAGEPRLGILVRVVPERHADHLGEVLGRRVQAPDRLLQARLAGGVLPRLMVERVRNKHLFKEKKGNLEIRMEQERDLF